ncbi:MAG: phosphopantothenoylcysteine decarboxylase [Elusimicrobia bacterium]|nr:phosphopantothenoylcysteine decarboxylase [Elusimicrobiota bacterium]
MKNKKVLITAGPTKEYIDPVRFISNDSSGKMGYFLAEEAKKRGAKTILISGPVNVKPPKGIKVVKVVSALQMFQQVKKYFKQCDIFISCAAVGDYRAEKISKNKIKKTGKPIKLNLIPNPDILLSVVQEHKNIRTQESFVIGFSLETENLEENARAKLKKKKLDMIIANGVNTINSAKTTGAIITQNGIDKFKNIPKNILAEKIFDKLENFKTLS